MKKNPKGFIALMSAIIISAILLLVVVSSSFTGFYGRLNILDSELKERSLASAEACVDEAILNLANDPNYVGNATFRLNSIDKCYLGTIPAFNPKTFRVQATSSGAVSNLQITIDASTLTVSSWQEIPNF